MPKLIIKRKGEYMNATRGINLFIDGSKVGKINNGKTEEYEVSAGTHTVIAKIDWCSSRDFEFTINDGETKYLQLSGIPYSNIIFAIFGGLFVLNFVLSITFKLPNYTTYIFIPFLAFFLYYLTFGRKDYLKIKQSDFYN